MEVVHFSTRSQGATKQTNNKTGDQKGESEVRVVQPDIADISMVRSWHMALVDTGCVVKCTNKTNRTNTPKIPKDLQRSPKHSATAVLSKVFPCLFHDMTAAQYTDFQTCRAAEMASPPARARKKDQKGEKVVKRSCSFSERILEQNEQNEQRV